MRKLLPHILLCSFLAAGNAQAQMTHATTSSNTGYGIYYSYDKHSYHFDISASDIAKTPEWNEVEEVPLAIPKASQSAKKELERLVGNTNGWKLSLVEITPYGDGKHWFYLVTFTSPPPKPVPGTIPGIIPDLQLPPPKLMIPVLMDGGAVAPEVGP